MILSKPLNISFLREQTLHCTLSRKYKGKNKGVCHLCRKPYKNCYCTVAQGLGSIFSKVGSGVEDTLAHINVAVTNAESFLAEMRSTIAQSAEHFSDVCKQAGEASSILKKLCIFIACISVLAACYYFRTYWKEVLAMVTLMLSGLAIWGMVGKPRTKIETISLDQCMSALQALEVEEEAQEAIAQSGSSLEYLAPFGTLLLTGASVLIIGALPGRHTVDEMLTRVGKIPQTGSGLQAIFHYMQGIWGKLDEFVQHNVVGDKEYKKALNVMLEVEQWAKQIDPYLIDSEHRKRLKVHPEDAEKIFRLYHQGLRLMAHRHEWNNVTQDYITTYFPKLSLLVDECFRSGILHNNSRPEPLCIMLHGEPGVGKTRLFEPLAVDLSLASGVLRPDDTTWNHILYMRRVDNEFWDGYKAQPIVCMDEYGQKVDLPGVPNTQFSELIDIVNTNAMQLRMAAVEDKSTSYFCSNLILLTSNLGRLGSVIKSVHTPDAVIRRIPYSYEVVPRPEFAKRVEGVDGRVYFKLDLEKIPASQGVIQTDLVHFYRSDLATGSRTFPQTALTYHDIITELSAAMKLRARQNVELRSEMANYLKQGGHFQLNKSEVQSVNNAITIEGQMNADAIVRYIKQGGGITQAQGGEELPITCPCDCENIFHDHPRDGYYLAPEILPAVPRLGNVQAVLQGANDRLQFAIRWCRRKVATVMDRYPYLSRIVAGGTVVLAGMATAATLWSIFRKRPASAAQSIYESGADRKPRVQAKVRSVRLAGSRVAAQSRMDENSSDLLDSLENNMYCISIDDCVDKKKIGMVIGNCFFIKDTIAIMPRHYLEQIPEPSILMLTARNAKHNFRASFSLMLKNSISDADQDIALVKFDRPNKYRDVTKHFMTEGEMVKLRQTPAVLACFQLADRQYLQMTRYSVPDLRPMTRYLQVQNKMLVQHDNDLVSEPYTYRVSNYCTYSVTTKKGDCGGPIVVNNTELPNKLVGFHFAATGTSHGHGTMVSRERLQFLLDEGGFGVCLAQSALSEEVIEGPPLDIGDVVHLGHLRKNVFRPSKTRIRPSPIYEKISAATTKPAHLQPFLRDGSKIDPGIHGLRKMGGPDHKMDTVLLDMAKHDVLRILLQTFNSDEDIQNYRRVLSYEEAITGVTGNNFLSGIKRGTACGYNLKKKTTPQQPGKTRFLGYDEYIFEGEGPKELREEYDAMMKKFRKGERPFLPYMDCLKDERRPIEKVDAGKTRIFSASCLEYVVAMRQYFLPFCAWIMHNRNHNEIAVGTNPYSVDWETIAGKLQRCGIHVIAGDFSNYDGSLNSQLLEATRWIVQEWYGDEHEDMRTALWREVANSVHIYGRNVYMCTHSNPSGNPMTTILNSICNMLLVRYAWLHTTRGSPVCNMKRFNANVSMVCYGDDNVINVTEEALGHFNQETIAEALATVGMVYTDESKGGDIRHAHRLLVEVRFLKRGFAYEKSMGRHLAPLDPVVVDEMLNWVRDKGDPRDLCAANMEFADRENALHCRERFEQRQRQMRQLSAGWPNGPSFQSWDTHRAAIARGQVLFDEDLFI